MEPKFLLKSSIQSWPKLRDLVRGLIAAAFELFAAPAAAFFFFFCFLPGCVPAGVIFFSAADNRYTLVVGSGAGVLPFAAFFRGKPRVAAAFAWWQIVCEFVSCPYARVCWGRTGGRFGFPAVLWAGCSGFLARRKSAPWSMATPRGLLPPPCAAQRQSSLGSQALPRRR